MKINTIRKVCLTVALVAGVLGCTMTFAAGNSGVAITAISKNISTTVSHLAIVLNDVALIAGIGFIMASFFKLHQHKLNPTQVPMSQGLTLLMIGAGLILFPVMLPTAKRAVFGNSAKIATVSGSAISGLIGGKG